MYRSAHCLKVTTVAALIWAAVFSAFRASNGSIPLSRNWRHSLALVRASAKLTVCSGPKPIARARPFARKRKIQVLAPLGVTCNQRPPPSPSIPAGSFVKATAASFAIPRAILHLLPTALPTHIIEIVEHVNECTETSVHNSTAKEAQERCAFQAARKQLETSGTRPETQAAEDKASATTPGLPQGPPAVADRAGRPGQSRAAARQGRRPGDRALPSGVLRPSDGGLR